MKLVGEVVGHTGATRHDEIEQVGDQHARLARQPAGKPREVPALPRLDALVGSRRLERASRLGDQRSLEAQPVERRARERGRAGRGVDDARRIVAAPAADDAERPILAPGRSRRLDAILGREGRAARAS